MRVNSLESDYYRASFMKNLLKGDCSESEGSGSEGNGSTCNEGRGTSEGFGSASSSVLLSISFLHSGPGGAFLSGETGEGGVDLGANLLGLEPGGGGDGIVGLSESSDCASSGGCNRNAGGCLNSRAVDTSHNHVPLGSGNSSSAGDGNSSGVVLGSSVGRSKAGVLQEVTGTTTTSLGIDGLGPEADNRVGGSNFETSSHPFVFSSVGFVGGHGDGDLVTIRVGLDAGSNLHDGVGGPGGGGGTSEGDVKLVRASRNTSGSTHSNSGHCDYVERKRKIIL